MTTTIFKYVTAIIFALAVLLFIAQVVPIFHSTAGKPLSFSLAPLTAQTLASVGAAGTPVRTWGIVSIDTSAGSPGVPYLIFETNKNKIGTKELIFDNGRNCNVTAGGLPCARNIDGTLAGSADTTPVPAGTPIIISGTEIENAIQVTSYVQASSTPPGMVIFTTSKNEKTQLSNGVTLQPTEVLSGAGCTVGIGCYGNSVQRVVTTVSSGKNSKVVELIPGKPYTYKDVAITVLAIADAQGTTVFKFLAALDS